MKNRLKTSTALAVAGAVAAFANADVVWPSDFWAQITNSMAIPAGTQIGTATASFAIDAPCWTFSVSNDTWLDSHRPGLIIIYN